MNDILLEIQKNFESYKMYRKIFSIHHFEDLRYAGENIKDLKEIANTLIKESQKYNIDYIKGWEEVLKW